jgi:hypothetical protein
MDFLTDGLDGGYGALVMKISDMGWDKFSGGMFVPDLCRDSGRYILTVNIYSRGRPLIGVRGLEGCENNARTWFIYQEGKRREDQ